MYLFNMMMTMIFVTKGGNTQNNQIPLNFFMNLARVLMKLSHEKLTIDLKDSSQVVGTLTGCDLRMNLHFKFATVTNKHGESKQHKTFSIRGNMIRYRIVFHF